MFKIIPIFLIILQILFLVKTSKKCDFTECNHEGECRRNEGNEKICNCIGHKYFKGPNCSQIVDVCQIESPCKNSAKCYQMVGQFICQDCKAGFGGLRCNLEIANIFKNMVLYFNHYGYYGKTHKFLIMIENLGEKEFSLEFVSDHYAIDSFETQPKRKSKWIYSDNLAIIIKKYGIRYYKDLPYTKGFYHLATETFWDLGPLELNLRSYESTSGTKLFYENQFQLLIVHKKDICRPHLIFIHGSNPLEPLMVDIATYNSFEIIVKKRCFKSSQILYQWSVYNSIGTVKLNDFGTTKETILKVRPYKLWFNYHGEVMSSYRLVVRMIEKYNDKTIITESRCFILVLPKPISAVIKGGNLKEIGVKQDLILDATPSRDYALPPSARQDMFFRWSCISKEDHNSPYCKRNMGSASILRLKSGQLKVQTAYNFTLKVNSKVNKLVFAETHQIIQVTENYQLLIDIQCRRNCERNQFVQEDIIHLQALSQNTLLSNTAKYKWSHKNEIIGRNQHLIYSAKDTDSTLKIELLVLDGGMQGKCVKIFRKNLAPINGSCSIEPPLGEAFKTNFHIKCKYFQDIDTPLSYQYLAGNKIGEGFPLQCTNDGEIYIKLPETSEVSVKICDQFQACLIKKLKVEIKEFEKPKDLKKFIRHDKEGLKYLLDMGDVLSAMVLIKSLSSLKNNMEYVATIVDEIQYFSLSTLLQVEQFLEVSKDMVNNNLPLDWHKAEIFNKLFHKLQQGFKVVIADAEITSFTRPSYEKSTKEFMKIMQQFSQPWQIIPPIQAEPSPMILAADPLKESYQDISDFNINIIQQLEIWLDSSRKLHDSFSNMIIAAKDLYKPLENIFQLEEDNLSLKICAFDHETRQEIMVANKSISFILNETCIKELQSELASQEILLQIAYLNSNPFWWYPSDRPINTQVVSILVLGGRKTSKTLKNLKNPFEFHLNINDESASTRPIQGFIKNKDHMPLYTIDLQANAMLSIIFIHIQKPLKVFVQFDKPPCSYEVSKSGYVIETAQTCNFINPLDQKSKAYLAILLIDPAENVTHTFYTEIRECLYWDFSLKDPQWSSKGCRPKLITTTNKSLSCFCHHLSTFAGRTYPGMVQENLREHSLLEELPFNWFVASFYIGLTFICLLILICNFHYYKTLKEFLPINSVATLKNHIEVHIFTGSHFNASSTANITLRLISPKGPFSLTIIQNSDKPFLQRNSLCKLRIAPQDVQIPLKLSISNNQAGRYPSWYCHKIMVINSETLQQQTFHINQWISQQTLEITSVKNNLKFKERFREYLSKTYMNWYQFQPLWGCWQYEDLNRLERCCIWLAQFICFICLLACYYGPTTMETYEVERNLYHSLSFNIFELFLLSTIFYLMGFVNKLLFQASFWLLNSTVIKRRNIFKNCYKIKLYEI